MKKTQIIYKNIDDLIPYVNNPRNNDHAVNAVASSINNFGFKVPIVIDKNNEIVNGHTRFKAAKKLKLTEVPVIVADELDDNQIRAFRLADNKLSELADWDEKLLNAEMAFIKDIDMTQFGFQELEDMLNEDVDEDTSPQQLEDKMVIIIEADTESELSVIYERLMEEGYNCQLSTF